uniref:DDHD domain-containing protein n=1 Tax=Globodera pallida TaxID=36090 RepID=A0A183BU11_GLOPA
MLVKEYRVLMPMSVEEYRLAQLLESSGAGSGVEIIRNEPYQDGPGGSGQYTFKIYHIGNRIPLWIRNVLPSTALEAHEEAWNAYPAKDPKLFKSAKTSRGPLGEKWAEEFVRDGKPIMCAYKLCKVQFRYWGLQTRAERWIHELALRGTMLRAHRQAWAWQDEWVGLSIEDIRRLERETQQYLTTLMSPSTTPIAAQRSGDGNIVPNGELIEEEEGHRGEEEDGPGQREEEEPDEEGEATSSSSQSAYFDCSDQLAYVDPQQRTTLIRWSSELLIGQDAIELDKSPPSTPKVSPTRSLLILVFHGDLFPKISADSKITDINTFRSILDTLIASHCPQLRGRIHVQAVQSAVLNANRVVNNFIISQSGKMDGSDLEIFVVGDFIGGILMYESLARTALAMGDQQRDGGEGCGELRSPMAVDQQRSPSVSMSKSPASALSSPYITHRASKENHPSRSLQSLPAGVEVPKFFSFDDQKLVQKESNTIIHSESPSPMPMDFSKNRSAPPSACRQLSNSSESSGCAGRSKRSIGSTATLSFKPSAAFLLGCPLALLLMQRKLNEAEQQLALFCDQLFNLFYSIDLCAARLEPVLNASLSARPALKVPRYQRYLLCDEHDIHFDNSVGTPMVWGQSRVDHELYCPPEMNSLPTMALPSILHASYWESKDLSAFILRQFLRSEELSSSAVLCLNSLSEQPPFELQVPLSVWNRRRTRFKVANLAANHQANDLIVVEGLEQMINARFCYGPMDLAVLSCENVLMYVLPSGGEWFLKGVETTDKNGRLSIDLERSLPIGIHNVRLIVQGDHTYLSVNIAVVPSGTPVVVFSIDGSLTASVSVTGRDPRLRPGAVDVVRFWQQQGYLIIYLTARPDMQQRLVSAWLATHNFPQGLLIFTPSLSTDPLRQKTQHIKHLLDMGICIQAAYGSAKDIPVYSNAGLEPERIFKVGGHRRRGCVSLDDGYCIHLHDLHSGKIGLSRTIGACENPLESSSARDQRHNPPELPKFFAGRHQSPIQRTLSFGPRTGRYMTKKISKVSSITTVNY